MKSTVYDFTSPPTIGALGDATLEPSFARRFERALAAKGFDAVCLPFQVAPRYLKNVVACMKLMDIVGLVVHPSHQRRIGSWLSTTEKLARDSGIVDTVVRQGNRFVGMSAWARAIQKIAGVNKKKPVMVVGARSTTAAASRAMKTYAFISKRALIPSQLARFPQDGIILDFTASKIRDARIVTPAMIESMSQNIAMELLFPSITG